MTARRVDTITVVPEEGRPPAMGTWIEIDRTCLRANVRALRSTFGGARLCMVVKGNAYGHSYGAVVPTAEEEGVRDFAVFSAREAAGFLAASDGNSRLMVMGPPEPDNLPWMIEHGLQPWISHNKAWQEVRGAVHAAGTPLRVHLEVETGMHRTGVAPDRALEIAQEIEDDEHITLAGVCSHLAGRESPENDPRTAAQKRRFDDFLGRLADAGIQPETTHLASSAAALMDPQCRYDMVRVGIATYGLWPSRHVMTHVAAQHPELVLRNVLTWKSRVVALRRVKDGEFVGYGRAYEAEGDTTVAIVGVGYADGFARALSNQGHVLIRGKRAAIVGTVNMNMIQCHVTHIPDTEIGDEVVIIGRQGDRDISVSSFSDFNNVVNYELMARLSSEIPRVVMKHRRAADPLD